jgi:hypothetical protein
MAFYRVDEGKQIVCVLDVMTTGEAHKRDGGIG